MSAEPLWGVTHNAALSVGHVQAYRSAANRECLILDLNGIAGIKAPIALSNSDVVGLLEILVTASGSRLEVHEFQPGDGA